MSRVGKPQQSFNGGELSPRLSGRADQAVYGIGVAEMLGWLPVIQGPAVAAPGTRYVAAAKGPFRLIPFEFNVTQGYQIEASAGAFRFYTNDVRIEPVAGTPYEVAHGWSYEQLLALDHVQSGDVLYLVGGGARPRMLSRTAAETFVLADLVLAGGPFEDDNRDPTITVVASGTTGSVTVTASAAIFAPDDVGGLFRIEARDFGDTPAWEAGITVSVGQKVRSAGKVYQATSGAGRTGTVPPVHDRGIAWDGLGTGADINKAGPYGEAWQFLYGPQGIVRITAVAADGGSCTAQVVTPLADSVTTTATAVWAFGAFSDRRGWPTAVAEWNGRLILAKDNWLYGSVVGGYDDHSERDSSGNAQRDLAFRVRLPDPNPIRWLAADLKLLIGTARAEYVAEQLQVQSEAASPPPIQVKRQSSRGTKAARPVQAGGRVLFIQRAERKLLELGYSLQSDRYEAPDLTRFAEHIGLEGFVEMAWAQEPEAQIWVVRGDGTLAAMTYSAEEQVHGWARRQLGGGLLARTCATISDPAGERDQLWIGAQAGDAWWVLRQERIWETGDDPASAFFVDAGLTYRGPAVKAGTGLDHLAGRTATVLADGKPHPDIVVGAGGAWAIDYPASVVTIGLAYPASLTTMPIEAGGDDGTAQGKVKRISQVTLRLLEAQGLAIRVQDGDAQPIETRVPANPLDRAVPLFSGDLPLATIGQHERFGQVTIARVQPTPATLLAVIPIVTTSPR